MDNSKFIQAQTFRLAGGGVSLSDTAISLQSFKLPSLVNITMSDVGSIGYGTIEPGSEREEIISFTGVTQNVDGSATLTGVTRGLKFVDPYDQDLSLRKPHSGNVAFILTNNPQMYARMANKENAESINATWDFTVSPTFPEPTSASHGTTKNYVDTITVAGSPDASTTVKGHSRITASPNTTLGTATITIASPAVVTFNNHGLTLNDSVQFTTTGALPTGITASTNYFVISTGLTANTFQVSTTLGGAAVITTGSQSGAHTLIRTTPRSVSENDQRIDGNAYAVSTGSANAYVVTPTIPVTAYVAGRSYSFTSNFANTGDCTVNFSGLGARNIRKLGGATSLDSGDIASGMSVNLLYDGTNMILLNPVANVPLTPTGDGSNLSGVAKVGFWQQYVGIPTLGLSGANLVVASNATGTELCFASGNGAGSPSWNFGRMQKDATTGMWFPVETVSGIAVGSVNTNAAGGGASLCYLGSNIYFSVRDSGAPAAIVVRFNATNLAAGATNMTISGTAPAQNNQTMYTNGTDLYIYGTGTSWYRYTIAGTTITNAQTLTGPNFSANNAKAWSDGTNVYTYDGTSLIRYAITLGSSLATLTRGVPQPFSSHALNTAGMVLSRTGVIGLVSSGLLGSNHIIVTPVTAP